MKSSTDDLHCHPEDAKQATSFAPASTGQSVPVIEEFLHVGTRLIDTGRGVRIHKAVLQTPHLVEQNLLQEEMTIEHVRHDRALEAGQVPEVRYEGETLIIPVLEEVLVVQKQLRLKEEIRVTRTRHSVSSSQTVMLDAEQVRLEHFDENDDTSASVSTSTSTGTGLNESKA